MEEMLKMQIQSLGWGRCAGGRKGNPPWCSCLENPTDGGAGYIQSLGLQRVRTWLKWLRMHVQRRSNCLLTEVGWSKPNLAGFVHLQVSSSRLGISPSPVFVILGRMVKNQVLRVDLYFLTCQIPDLDYHVSFSISAHPPKLFSLYPPPNLSFQQ